MFQLNMYLCFDGNSKGENALHLTFWGKRG